MSGYVFDTLWRAGDGSMIRRRLEMVEDPDGQPLGIEFTEEPFTPPAWPYDDAPDEQ